MHSTFVSPDSTEWAESLKRLRHDVYHTPQYSELFAQDEEACPLAFVAEENGQRFFVPLLLRPVALPVDIKDELFDASTPYGYSGPLIGSDNDNREVDAAFTARACDSLRDGLRQRKVVSAFLRLHPILKPAVEVFSRFGTQVSHGRTVFINLADSIEEMWQQTRSGHRNEINRARKNGLTVEMDEQWNDLDRFYEIYNATMRRVNASERYFFSKEYFQETRDHLGRYMHLCIVRVNGQVAGGGLFSESCGVVQYHLAGTADEYVRAHPSKLMLDFVRRWAKERNNEVFHLGGGSDASEDSLFRFKSGFSRHLCDFRTVRLIIDEMAYTRLVDAWQRVAGSTPDTPEGFFPPYSKPIPNAARGVPTSKRNLPVPAQPADVSDEQPARIHLSPPDMSGRERELLLDAFDSNWIAPLGPHVDEFEREFADRVGVKHAVALSSGTAALHLALLLMGVESGDEVVTSTLTFAATANAIRYVGANPVFVDSEQRTWNMAPELLAEELEHCVRRGHRPKAAMVVDVFGQCADYEPILKTCRFYEIPVIEDAAEALGATYRGSPAGSLGDIGCFSFNGNKIITTSSGGMLTTNRDDWARRARFLASQAKDPAPHYEHSEVGYNYRLSNLLAAIGRGQLRGLDERVERRRAIFEFYRRRLGDLPGVSFMPELAGGTCTRWLTCILVDPCDFGASREDIRIALSRENIESRPIWKAMHMQPAFQECRARGGSVAEHLFQCGLCLPSGSNLSEDNLTRVVQIIRSVTSSRSSITGAKVNSLSS